MKKLLTIVLFVCGLSAGATTYYVKTGGNDGLAGTSDVNAWGTIAKIQATAFSAGDSILFKRANTFRGSLYKNAESGAAGNYIYFGAYGTGVKPKILGAKDLSASGDWTNDAGNIWKTTATLGTAQNDISNMVFNTETSWGTKQLTKVACDAQGDFFYNGTDDLLYMYSVGNPGTFYTHIEACGNYDIDQGLLKWYESDYIIVENLDVRYSSGAGIEFRNAAHLSIKNNDISWIGGEYVSNDGSDPYRLGNGISLIIDIDDAEVESNRISQCYDEGIAPQGWGTYSQTNINCHNNIIDSCWVSMSLFTRTGSTIDNVKFNNNTSIEPGMGWSDNQRPDPGEEAHFRNYLNTQPATNVEICNNIFYGGKTFGMYLWAQGGFTITNNIYYDIPTDAYYRSTSYTLAQFQAATGFDANSFDADPLFVSASDFHLQAASPAKDAGISLGLSVDFDATPIGYLPDIGAFEFEDIRMATVDDKIVMNTGKIVTIRK
jgi:hypothetical protein